MNKKIFLFASFIGLIGLMLSCEKDETKVTILADPIKPVITAFPDLTFNLANENDTLIFRGSPASLGFQASVNYILECCLTGANFTPATAVVRVFYGPQDSLMTITEKKLNTSLNKKIPPLTTGSVDFRLRCVFTVDAGTGAKYSSKNPLEIHSEYATAMVTTY